MLCMISKKKVRQQQNAVVFCINLSGFRILSIHTLKDGKTESGSSCLLASFTNLILASILFCNSILSFFLSAAFVLLFDLVILIKVLQLGQVLLLNDVIYFVSMFFLNKFENDVYLFPKLFGFVWRGSNFSLPAKKNNKARVTVKGL